MSVIETLKSYLASDSTDVRALLREDHRRISELAKAMAEEKTAAKRRALYDELKPLLTAHARSEEETVYRAMIDVRGNGESRDLGNEGFVEHSLVDVLLERLGKSELAGSDAWKAHAQVLKEMLDHHVREEEGEFFDVLGRGFDDRQREAMAADFERRKAEIMGEVVRTRARRKR